MSDPPPAASEAGRWVKDGKGLAGIVPGSVGLFVVDVDEGGAVAVEAVAKLLGARLACIRPSVRTGPSLLLGAIR